MEDDDEVPEAVYMIRVNAYSRGTLARAQPEGFASRPELG